MATLDIIKFPEGLDDCTVLETVFDGQERLLIGLKLWNDKAAILRFEDVLGYVMISTMEFSFVAQGVSHPICEDIRAAGFDRADEAKGYIDFAVHNDDQVPAMYVVAKSVHLDT